MLQSSLHMIEGMGVVNLSVLYAVFVLSCLVLPTFMISSLGHKHTIILAFSGYIVWQAANGYATWWTMLPASVIIGASAAPLWTAQSSYLTLIGRRYAKLTGEADDVIITRFFGIFYTIFQLCEYQIVFKFKVHVSIITIKSYSHVVSSFMLQQSWNTIIHICICFYML